MLYSIAIKEYWPSCSFCTFSSRLTHSTLFTVQYIISKIRVICDGRDNNNRDINPRIPWSAHHIVNFPHNLIDVSPAADYDSSLPKGCIPVNIPRWCWAYWVPPVTFDTILLFLALWKTVRVFIIRDSALQPPLLVTVLLRDSFLYFGGVIISTLANFLTWYFKPVCLLCIYLADHLFFCLPSMLIRI